MVKIPGTAWLAGDEGRPRPAAATQRTIKAYPVSQKVAGTGYHAYRSVALHRIGSPQIRKRGAFNPLYAFSALDRKGVSHGLVAPPRRA
jgi:hypothetical protein